MKKLTILILLFATNTFAQEYVSILDETLVVNSRSSITGNTRNIAEVPLPKGTIGYAYRISIFSKGKLEISQPLLDLIKASTSPLIAAEVSLAQLAIKNNDGNSVDAFIFNNVYDANNFQNKKDNDWNSCKSMLNRKNCCFATNHCINNTIYFGFRNNNIGEGLEVHLEVVAIIDKTNISSNINSYSILNSTGKELKYFLSTDNVNWQQILASSGYTHTVSYNQSKIYFKIYTNDGCQFYNLIPDLRYKIVWNQLKNMWDLVHY